MCQNSNFCYFIQVAYREVAKEMLPSNLYPTPTEYRQAVEKYLAENAEHYIESIGHNAWISLFTQKIHNEVCHKTSAFRK